LSPTHRAAVHSANALLLGNYIAGSLVTAAGGIGTAVIAETSEAASQQSLLSHPHT
jgi:hypothetical protein